MVMFTLKKDKTINCSKFKAFSDNKINVTEKIIFILETVENTVRKVENAGHQHFLLFSQ